MYMAQTCIHVFQKSAEAPASCLQGKSKKGQRHQQRTALSMSLPLGAPVFRSISMPIVYFLHCLFFPIVTISCPPMSSHSFVSWHEIFLVHEYYYIQDSLASLARRMRVDMSCFSKTCQHLPNRIRAHPRGAFILHRGIVPTMKRVSLFARVSHD